MKRLLQSISGQVNSIVVVDNASEKFGLDVFDNYNVSYIQNSSNEGLATGQNIGIEFAKKNLATHVLIFDQDSEPNADMVERLLSAEEKLINMGYQVAAVGPKYIDVKTKEFSPFIFLKNFHILKKRKPDFDVFVESSCLISSGQLIRCCVFDVVGVMRDEFFIDFIDIEWGLRAGVNGYKSFGVLDAQMNHNLGDDYVRVGKKTVSLHSALRHYYIIRNSIFLYKDAHIPMAWKIADSVKFFTRFFSYFLLSNNKLKHLKYMLHGIFDGLTGRSGSFRGKKKILN